ncbi:ABC transporter ATP-binding protein [Anaerolineales bacterium]
MTEAKPKTLLEVDQIVKIYDSVAVLKKVSFELQSGDFIALLGPNGSGKSTLLRLLVGLSKPSSGHIRMGGWRIPEEASQVRAHIGFISHKTLLYENLTAKENLTFFASLYGLDKQKATERIQFLLEEVGLSQRADSLVRTYSRGMQQRLSIARALLHEPDVLMLDEPFTGLDQDAAFLLEKLVQQTHAAGNTLIMATHQLERAARLVNRVLILNRGQVAYDEALAGLDGVGLAKLYAGISNKVKS